MNCRPFGFGDQGIGRLANSVVAKCVGVLQEKDQARSDRLPERRMNRRLRLSQDRGHYADLGDVTQTSQMSQRYLRMARQTVKLFSDELHTIVGVAFRFNW